jgi:hypothetical protein
MQVWNGSNWHKNGSTDVSGSCPLQRNERTFQIQHYATRPNDLRQHAGLREPHCYELVIDSQNALGRLYIRHFKRPLG